MSAGSHVNSSRWWRADSVLHPQLISFLGRFRPLADPPTSGPEEVKTLLATNGRDAIGYERHETQLATNGRDTIGYELPLVL